MKFFVFCLNVLIGVDADDDVDDGGDDDNDHDADDDANDHHSDDNDFHLPAVLRLLSQWVHRSRS